jgi:hypothetical protein
MSARQVGNDVQHEVILSGDSSGSYHLDYAHDQPFERMLDSADAGGG